MSKNTKVKAAMGKVAREIPIIAWAVEMDGKITPDYVLPTRATARYLRNFEAENGSARKVHVRKVKLQVIPGR